MRFRDEGLRLTLDGLFRIEIISHGLDTLINLLNLTNNNREILEDKTARNIRMLAMELFKIVTDGPTNVDDHGRVAVKTLDEALLDGIEARVHPRRTTLVVTAHMVVELDTIGSVCLEMLEEVFFSVEGKLKRAIRDAVRSLPIILLGIGVELIKSAKATTRPLIDFRSEIISYCIKIYARALTSRGSLVQ